MKPNTPSYLLAAGLLTTMLAGGIWIMINGRSSAASPRPNPLHAITQTLGDSANSEIRSEVEKIRKSPDSAKLWIALGDRLMQKVRETENPACLEAAEKSYYRAIKIEPKSVEAMTGISRAHGAHHEFAKSIEWAKTSLAVDPENHAAYGLLGDAAVELGDNEEALKSYQKMLDLRPDLSSYSRAGHLMSVVGDPRRGIWMMQKAIKAGAPNAENTAWCRAELSKMLFNAGALLPAEQVAESALKQTPDSASVLVAVGRIRLAKKNYEGAIEAFESAAKIAPRFEVFVSLGEALEMDGRGAEARAAYSRAEEIHRAHQKQGIQGDSQMAKLWVDQGRNLMEALKLAELDYKQFKNVFAADALAWCYYKNGIYQKAEEMIHEAMKYRTPDAAIHFHAGMIHAKLGESAEARKQLYRALSLNPHFDARDEGSVLSPSCAKLTL